MLINPTTKETVENFTANPSHAVIMTGPAGAGKTYIARHIASAILAVDSLENYPYYMETEVDKQSIDTVRKIKTFLAKKTTGTNRVRRVIVLNNADSLSDAAQNALLKSIEEPPSDTVLILTVDDITQLLPTIQSRCTTCTVLPVTETHARDYFSSTYDESDVRRAYVLSKGYAGLLQAVLSQPEHELQSAVILAKEILSGSTFDKITKVEELTKGKISAVQVLHAIEVAIKMNFQKAVDSGNKATQQRLHTILKHITLSREQLAAKTNAKLVLTRLFLEM